nr:hypothetical protein [Pandoravirus belohorizontensis]
MSDERRNSEAEKFATESTTIGPDGRLWYTAINRRTAWERFLARHPPRRQHLARDLGVKFFCATNRDRPEEGGGPLDLSIKGRCHPSAPGPSMVRKAYREAQRYCEYAPEPERCVADLVTAIYDDDDDESQPVPYVAVDEVSGIVARCGVSHLPLACVAATHVALERATGAMGGPIAALTQWDLPVDVKRDWFVGMAQRAGATAQSIECLRDALPLYERRAQTKHR